MPGTVSNNFQPSYSPGKDMQMSMGCAASLGKALAHLLFMTPGEEVATDRNYRPPRLIAWMQPENLELLAVHRPFSRVQPFHPNWPRSPAWQFPALELLIQCYSPVSKSASVSRTPAFDSITSRSYPSSNRERALYTSLVRSRISRSRSMPLSLGLGL